MNPPESKEKLQKDGGQPRSGHITEARIFGPICKTVKNQKKSEATDRLDLGFGNSDGEL